MNSYKLELTKTCECPSLKIQMFRIRKKICLILNVTKATKILKKKKKNVRKIHFHCT